jgi:hypothetical protein
MQSIVGKTFRDQEIVVDDKTAYISCKFIKCHLIYMGGDFSLLNCKLDNCPITITGPAGKTLEFMQCVGMITPGAPPPQPPPALGERPDSGATH